MIDYSKLPDHMQDGAKRYIEDRIPPGGFLYAVLCNNLVEAFGHADSTNQACMQQWAQWLYWECPRAVWGSPAKVDAWLAGRGNAG